jgi:hypothetical protein
MEHPADAFARAPRLVVDALPIATMGGASGDPAYDLTYADHVVVLDDERVVALAGIGNRLMMFDRNGRGVWLYSRTGKGPGDLMAPHGLVRASGDTLLIPDISNQRVNRVIPGQGIVSQSPLSLRDRMYVDRMAGVMPKGEFVMHRASSWGGGMPLADTTSRSLAPVMLVDPATGETRQIATLPDLDIAPLETRFRGRKRVGLRPVRLGRSAHIAVWDSLIATATGEAYRIDLRNADGEVVARLQVPVPRRAVSQPMRDAQIAVELERFEGQRTERMVDPAESRRLIYDEPFVDSLPPYSGIFVTRGKTLWVVDAIAPGDSSWSATAFRADGAIAGRLTVQGRSQPVAFTDDRVVVRSQDENGVVALQVFSIRPEPGTPIKGN